jgi:hypothetical protein
MVRQYGKCTFFETLSAAERRWNELLVSVNYDFVIISDLNKFKVKILILTDYADENFEKEGHYGRSSFSTLFR